MASADTHLHRATVRLEGGLQFQVCTNPDDHDDPVSAQLRSGRFPLARLYELLRRCVPAGGRVIDLGAHVGSFTLAAAAAGYEVLCIEASPQNAELVRNSVETNGFANVRLENVAISDRDGTLQFHSRGPYGHLATGGEAGNVAVEATTLDKLLDRTGWAGRVDFIKIDIEGSEVAALRGMGRTLRPGPILFCESNGHMLDVFGETPTSLKRTLFAAGYEVFCVEQASLVPVSEEDVQGRTVVDYLACRELPGALASEAVLGGAPLAQSIDDLSATARSSVAEERRYAARVLRDSWSRLSSQPGAAQLCTSLRSDKDESVRAIASTIEPGPAPSEKKPWWRVI